MSNKDKMYSYTVEGSKPGKCETFYNNGHFVLMNILLTDNGTIDIESNLEEFETFLEDMNHGMIEAANEKNKDHAMANMDADVSADRNMLGE